MKPQIIEQKLLRAEFGKAKADKVKDVNINSILLQRQIMV